MNPLATSSLEALAHVTRRHFLGSGSLGLGGLALSSLLGHSLEGASSAEEPFAPTASHYPARVKNVILLSLSGGPSHLDLFDYKPELSKRDGQDCPASLTEGKPFAFTSGTPKLLGTPQKFAQYGQSGAWVSAAMPNVAAIADELTFIKSLHTDQFNHGPAELLLLTGIPRTAGRPSIGSWVTYGLGSESQDVPGFIVFTSGGSLPSSGKAGWGSGFLPSVYQGVQCRTGGDPVLYLSDPEGMDRSLRRQSLDALNDLNRIHARQLKQAETATRIAQYEMAFRMQAVVPELMDLSQEPAGLLEDYGAQPGAASFANNCLLARRLVEKGVRFVQLSDWGWDFHGTNPNEDLRDNLVKRCTLMDRPVAALIRDLKNRGLLDETLVIWIGEFGRTPFREGRTAAGPYVGRDHHPFSNTMFMAGGGLKRGYTLGATDELGFNVVENPVHIHDIQATILHLLGLDHTKLTYRFQGRDYRLTDVGGKVIQEVLA
ncbi:DUF1501 domain-containing protein [Schlesneria sp.]|uniref:DUF1501 domain-containing protein n=1 Tax=Schlesneria sp. TaxID=2762018 RepID=UPI002EFB90D5